MEPTHQPYVSIILPTYNENTLLVSVVSALCSQSYPPSLLDVIIVDDCSSIPVSSFISDDLPVRITIIRHTQNMGRASARNTGLIHATGELVIFLDSDIIPDHHLVEQHVNCYIAGDKKAVLGTVRWHPDVKRNNFTRFGKWFEYDTVLDKPELDFNDFAGANVSIEKALLTEYSIRFDSNFTAYGMEDIELGYQLKQQGFRFLFCPSAIGLHCRQATLGDQIKRSEQSAHSIHYFLSKYNFDSTISDKLHIVPHSVYEQFIDIFDKAYTRATELVSVLDSFDRQYYSSFEEECYATSAIFLIESAPYRQLYHSPVSTPELPTLIDTAVDRALRVVLISELMDGNASGETLFKNYIQPLSDNPLKQSLCHELGRYFILLNMPEDVKYILEKGLMISTPIDKTYFLMIYLLASVHKNESNYYVASLLFNRIIQEGKPFLHKSQYASALFHTGQILLTCYNTPSEASTYFKKAVELCPEHKSARLALVTCA
ncbi:MAG: glycosyltransferase family 2 protein [Candidatus Auribacterota bacterium]